MKYLSLFLALILSVILISCTNTEPEQPLETPVEVDTQEDILEDSKQEEILDDTKDNQKAESSTEEIEKEDSELNLEEKTSVSPEDLIDRWDYIFEAEGQEYILWLNLLDESNVEYVFGWYRSEMFELFRGKYKIEENILILENLADAVYGEEDRNSKFEFELLEDELKLTLIEGDSLVKFQTLDNPELVLHRQREEE